MKTLILSLMLLAAAFIQPAHAQKPSDKETQEAGELARLEKSLENINADLQEKKLEYSWKMAEAYMEYCKGLTSIEGTNLEPRLTQLATVLKPQELEPLRLAYEKANKELYARLDTYPEYVLLDSLSKKSLDTETRNNARMALKEFYKEIYNEDAQYKELLLKKKSALKEHYIACVAYLLDESKRDNTLMPEKVVPNNVKRELKESDVSLQQLTMEINNLENLQRQAIRKCQQLKYGISNRELEE